jgi:hypothetical protein
MAVRRRTAAAIPTPTASPTSGKGRRRPRVSARVSAAEIEGRKLTERALAEAETDEATRALLSEPTTVEIVADDEELDDTEEVDLTAPDEDAPPDVPQAPPPALLPAPAVTSVAPAIIRHHRGRVYLPDAKRHMSEMGPVCTINWIGMVGGQRVSVRYGAPLSAIPMNVRQELAKNPRVRFAIAPPPERRGGGVVLDGDDQRGPPRARRSNPKGRQERVHSRFTPIRHFPVE